MARRRGGGGSGGWTPATGQELKKKAEQGKKSTAAVSMNQMGRPREATTTAMMTMMASGSSTSEDNETLDRGLVVSAEQGDENATSAGTTPPHPPTTPVAIVIGAGLAGLAVALALVRNDHYTVHLVERRTTFDRQGATFGLQPNGVLALDELDPAVMDIFAAEKPTDWERRRQHLQ